MKLILIPLTVVVILAMLSVAGLGTGDLSGTYSTYDVGTSKDLQGNLLILYDSGNNPVCYWNGTVVAGRADTNGYIVQMKYVNYAAWKNNTIGVAYLLYWDDEHGGQLVEYDRLKSTEGIGVFTHYQIDPDSSSSSFDFTTSLSVVIIISVLISVATIAGLKIKFVGSGVELSDVSVEILTKLGFYLTIWLILSLISYPLILEGGFLVFIIYFVLSLMYTIGIVQSFGGSGSTV